MGKNYTKINKRLTAFIQKQKLFFVATAAPDGRVNISPKGIDTFRILNEREVLWLNLTGSGNEMAAHLIASSRMTLMFCAFSGNPLILRLYGRAKVFHPRDAEWKTEILRFPKIAGARQIVAMSIDAIHSSCGMGIPIYQYEKERRELIDWAEDKGQAGLRKYWEEKNRLSIDGKETGISAKKKRR